MAMTNEFMVRLMILTVLLSSSVQKPSWKAEIKSEGGVGVIVNPSSPVYGEFHIELAEDLVIKGGPERDRVFGRVWDVKADGHGNIFILDAGNQRILKFDSSGRYLKTIGRQGQGPGEFQTPVNLRIDRNGLLYVLDMRKVHVFTPEGTYVKTINIPSFLMDFIPDGEGRAVISGYVRTERTQDLGIRLVDEHGILSRAIAQFPGLPFGRGGATLSHDYSPDLRICGLGNEGFIYGYSPRYKIYCADWSGKTIRIIAKDEPSRSVGVKEKDRIINDYLEITGRGGFSWTKEEVERAADIPRNRPFFKGIMTDDRGRIYIEKVKSVLEEGGRTEYDIFSREGYLLYASRPPFSPSDIRAGCFYSIQESADTGEVRVVRHRITNWGRMAASHLR